MAEPSHDLGLELLRLSMRPPAVPSAREKRQRRAGGGEVGLGVGGRRIGCRRVDGWAAAAADAIVFGGGIGDLGLERVVLVVRLPRGEGERQVGLFGKRYPHVPISMKVGPSS